MQLEKRVVGGWVFIRTLTGGAGDDWPGYLLETYGKRADQFRVVPTPPPLTPARLRAMDADFNRAVGRPTAPMTSAATAILAHLSTKEIR